MKALIIGFGSIGKRHYEVLSSVLNENDIYIVSRRDIGKKNHVYNIDQIPNIQTFDYFIIASKTSEHYIDLLQLNNLVQNKIILVEKPLYAKQENAIDIHNTVLVAYNLRFHPMIQNLKLYLKEEIIISARFYAGQYLPTWRPNTDYSKSYSAKKEEGGGILLDYSHDIDLLQYFLGEVESFEAFNNKISDLEITSDDYLTMIGITKNKVNFNLTLDSISKLQKREILVHTNNLSIEVDLINNILKRKDLQGNENIIENTEIDRNTTFTAMHKDVINNELSEFTTYDEGIVLANLFDKIRINSNQKDW